MRRHHRQRQGLGWAGFIVVAALVIGTIVVAVVEWQRQVDAAAQRHMAVAEEATALLASVRDNVVAVRTAAALVDEDGSVEPDRFYKFAESVVRDPMVLSVGLEPRLVGPDELASFQSATGIQVYERDDRGEAVPTTARDEYFPVQLVHPDPFAPIVGFDINSEGVRAEALSRARRSGDPALTAPTELGPVDRPGVLVVVPLFVPGADVSTPEARLAATVAVVTVGYFVDQLTGSVLPVLPAGTGLSVTDDGVTLIDAGDPTGGARTSIEVGERLWLIEARHPDDASGWPVVVVLAVGALLSAVAAAGFWTATRQQRRVAALHGRTVFLQAATAALAEAITPDAVAEATVSHVMAVPGVHGVSLFQLVGGGLVPLAGGGTSPTSRPPTIHDLERRGFTITDVGTSSIVTTALRGARGTRGAAVVVFRGEPAPDDAAFIEAVTLMAGAALDRAELHSVEHDIAETFQQQLRAASVRDIAGVGMGVVYEPALDAAGVGGDWYDVFDLGDRTLVVAIGDVVGAGVSAAAAAVELRVCVRSLAGVLDLTGAVARLDTYAASIPGAFGATAAVLRFDLKERVVDYLLAGHPPPILIDESGHRLLERGHRPLLGCGVPATEGPDRQRFHGRARLVCYTDGFVEAVGEPIDEGVARLRAAAADTYQVSASEAAEAIARACREGAQLRGDDRLVLCIDVDPPDPTS
jgi:serine phosphatase RsbU (regulator of sigma subunit)/CHASE1-domain containing sensor protein